MHTPHLTVRNTQSIARTLATLLFGRLESLALALVLIGVLASPSGAQAQCQPGWVPGSGLAGVQEGSVGAVVVLPDGDVIAGGTFTGAGGVPVNGIARYNPTTKTWSALGSGLLDNQGFPGQARAMVVLPGGDVIVGGTFELAGGVPARSIARYNPASNTWSAPSIGVSNFGFLGSVYALALLPDGRVVVGGTFDSAGGLGFANSIAIYNPSNDQWSLTGGVGFNSAVYSLAVLPGGTCSLVVCSAPPGASRRTTSPATTRARATGRRSVRGHPTRFSARD